MKTSKWQIRHPLLLGSATSAAAIALIVAGVPALALAHTRRRTRIPAR